MPNPIHATAYRDQPDEHAFVATVEGTLPAELRGTVLRNGPGRLRLGADVLNWFDGHALIAGVTFEDGRATFRSRYVHTPLLDKERAQGRILQRRVFTNHPQRWSNLGALDLGHSNMHDVFAWGEGDDRRVIASNDPGHVALDPVTLETRGPETYGGAAKKGWDIAPMPYPDPHTGNLVLWMKKGGLTDQVKFVEVDPKFQLVRETPMHKLGRGLAVIHDQRASARWYVTVESALQISLVRALWGQQTVWEALDLADAAHLVVVARDGGAMHRVALPGVKIAFHVVNAFDDGDRLVVDVAAYDGGIRFFATLPPDVRAARGIPDAHGATPRLTRFVVDTAQGKVVDKVDLGVVGDAPEVADTVMGRPYRYAYVPTRDDTDDMPDRGAYTGFGRLARLDVTTRERTTWSPGPDALVAPPTFVPRGADEGDGWLLSWVLRESGAEVVVLDAPTMTPIATVKLGIHLPTVSHTRWAPDVRLAP